jgi:hypothetical protein
MRTPGGATADETQTDATPDGAGAESDGAGQGIGLGNLGRLAPGGSTGKQHATIREGETRVVGALPPTIISRIVRQNFGRFRLCYESGRSKNPKLAGQFSIHFRIESDGTIAPKPTATSRRLADEHVVECVLQAMGALSFPQPSAGVVDVTYELVFQPAQ